MEAFYLGKFELTQAERKLLMGTNPSAHQGEGFSDAARMPVEGVSWNDCQALIQKLNERVPGGGFRLPTEEEWEYAARAGSSGPLQAKGLADVAWFRENSGRRSDSGGVFSGVDAYAPRPVGVKEPNGWGLYDMQGNVWEWTSSAFVPYFRPAVGRESSIVTGLRVLRGGRFADPAEALDYALRHGELPHRRYRWNGLRLARSVPGRQSKVKLQLHPNDPPMDYQCVPRLFKSQVAYRRAMEMSNHSPYSGLLFCVGCWSEMPGPEGKGEDIPAAIQESGARGHIFDVHFRNVSNHLPNFYEAFPSDGYTNMYRVMRALGQVNYSGPVVYDHVLRCASDRLANRPAEAFCFGYIRAMIHAMETELGRWA